MFRWFNTILDRIFAIAGALIFLQAPQFFQQYTNRLSGRLDELRVLIANVQQHAEKSGRGLTEYIHKFLQQTDPDFIAQGNMMQMMVDRQENLTNSWIALQEATPFTRPYYFLKYLNFDVFQTTFKDFQPGLTLTVEGLIYAVLGTCVGIFIYQTFLFIVLRSLRALRYFALSLSRKRSMN